MPPTIINTIEIKRRLVSRGVPNEQAEGIAEEFGTLLTGDETGNRLATMDDLAEMEQRIIDKLTKTIFAVGFTVTGIILAALALGIGG